MKIEFRSQMWLGVVVLSLCGMVVAEGDRHQNGVPERSTAVFHDDFLSDFTCLHDLTLDQLQQPGSGAAFVTAAHSLGFRVFADPARTEADWDFFASLGVDAIYSDIPLGVRRQPVIPDP